MYIQKSFLPICNSNHHQLHLLLENFHFTALNPINHISTITANKSKLPLRQLEQKSQLPPRQLEQQSQPPHLNSIPQARPDTPHSRASNVNKTSKWANDYTNLLQQMRDLQVNSDYELKLNNLITLLYTTTPPGSRIYNLVDNSSEVNRDSISADVEDILDGLDIPKDSEKLDSE